MRRVRLVDRGGFLRPDAGLEVGDAVRAVVCVDVTFSPNARIFVERPVAGFSSRAGIQAEASVASDVVLFDEVDFVFNVE